MTILQLTEQEESDQKIKTSTHDFDRISLQWKLKTREIILRSDIERSYSVTIVTGWTCIVSADSKTDYIPKRDFNEGMLKNLRNTKNIVFFILERNTWEFQKLDIPTVLSEKIWEYLRNMQEIESDEKYRLPDWLKNYPVNCKSFVYYIKWWFQNIPKLSLEYIKNEEDGNEILPWDILFTHEWDEWNWEYWHYMIYIGDWFCISKNGYSHLVITRHYLKWLYRVIAK